MEELMAEVADNQARTWGILCHLAGLCLWIGIPFGNIVGPLLIWLLKRDEFPLVRHEGKESVNFQISMTLYAIVAGILCFVLIGIPLLIALGIAQIALTIVAAVKVSNGESYRYPFTIRLIN